MRRTNEEHCPACPDARLAIKPTKHNAHAIAFAIANHANEANVDLETMRRHFRLASARGDWTPIHLDRSAVEALHAVLAETHRVAYTVAEWASLRLARGRCAAFLGYRRNPPGKKSAPSANPPTGA